MSRPPPPEARAREFDETLAAGSKTVSYLEVARYMADVEARLRKEDKTKLMATLGSMKPTSTCEEIKAAKDKCRLLLSSEPGLLARFDDFLKHAAIAMGKKVSSDAERRGQPSGSSSASPAASTPGDSARSGSDSCTISMESRLGRDQVRRLKALPNENPDAFSHILFDELDEEPVLDYITDLETRREIFEELQKLSKTYDEPGLNAMTLGIVMVAPIMRLQALVREMKSSLDKSSGLNQLLWVQGFTNFMRETAVQGIKALKTERQLEVCPYWDAGSRSGLYCRLFAAGNEGLQSGELKLKTGQTFILRAQGQKDTTSIELLQLSWDLLRVAAICGAATDDTPNGENDESEGRSVGAGSVTWEGNERDELRRWAVGVAEATAEERDEPENSPKDSR
ncbi:hypothetical protein SAPIO_CDS9419 [Scedosporium apiospermum]|uniref:Uncharacterized protein n=1 Tax=Pseudallescheria apiosperma TaxID=563466 RepID=A0A084FWS5_PSEDA|nr:uncharacterized protein SAPIO_CDS9419 [Scedosporium apiospermum]KEZ39537.1 hypothetical protein SAPIO_CDS9419 [Scedosporium apiospermum]